MPLCKCCIPVECCNCAGATDERSKRDQCACGCAYLNGGFQVAAAQALLLFGVILSFAALGDCSFVEISSDAGIPTPFETQPDEWIQRVGFFTYQKPDGKCYWYSEREGGAVDDIRDYLDLLGSDWQIPRILGAIALGAGWLYFLYSTSFCCSAQVASVRFFNAFLIATVLTTLQGLTMLVFSTDFCNDYDCVFERAAGFSAFATGCFFLSGLCFAMMSDWPGRSHRHHHHHHHADHQKSKKEKDASEEADPEQPLVAAAATGTSVASNEEEEVSKGLAGQDDAEATFSEEDSALEAQTASAVVAGDTVSNDVVTPQDTPADVEEAIMEETEEIQTTAAAEEEVAVYEEEKIEEHVDTSEKELPLQEQEEIEEPKDTPANAVEYVVEEEPEVPEETPTYIEEVVVDEDLEKAEVFEDEEEEDFAQR